MVKHTVREELRGVLVFVSAIWCVFLVGYFLPINFLVYGLTPRSLAGLVGIPLMPFLHSSWVHVLGNTVPLVVLLVLLAGSQARSWEIVVSIVLLGGALLWLFGRPATHVGASGLIYGLITFLLVSGFLERRVAPLLISVLVGLFYGGTLLSGIVPDIGSHVSWDGHLAGAIAGVAVARRLTQSPVPRPAQET